MFKKQLVGVCLTLMMVMFHQSLLGQETYNSLFIDQAVKIAQENDPWIDGNKHLQDATKSMSVAAGSLPDPQVSLSLTNLPTDSFSFSKEGMAQVRVGVSQMFPQGDSLNIKKKQLELQAGAFPYQREDRLAQVAVTVSNLWLDAYNAQKSIALIEQNRALFEQLAEVAMSSYSSAMGKTRQQDIIRAQLELTRLNDRVKTLQQTKDVFIERLSEWLNTQSSGYTSFEVTDILPTQKVSHPELTNEKILVRDEELYTALMNHPMMKSLEQNIDANDAGVDLAKQKYKPEWGLNAAYGRRNADPFGNSRSDVLTVGVTFSVPLFTANRQDKEYSAAISKREAIKTEKWQLLRKLRAGFETSKAQLARLDERKDLFESKLLPQMAEQAEASLTAYTNDDGDFAEVVRARIAELNAQIDSLNINVERQKTITQLNYYLTASDTAEHNAGDAQ